MEFRPIGTIHTPFKALKNMPIQPSGGAGIEGTIELLEEYRDGLKDLDGFSHITLLFHLHRSDSFELQVVPYLDRELRGLFATRAPRRPNPIGLSTVELIKIEDCTLHIRNLDMLDGTPLLDIKPYVRDFDSQAEVRFGWLEEARKRAKTKRSDGRFE